MLLLLLLQALLEPLQRTGVLVRRTSAELRAQLPNFTVIERETKVGAMACCTQAGVSEAYHYALFIPR